MPVRTFTLLAVLSGFLAVALGAFGAHALKSSLNASFYQAYQTAVEYQFYHTLVLLFLTRATGLKHSLLSLSGWSFILGILLFCGSLYLMAITGVRSLGMITPLGGVAFLVGWGVLAFAVLNPTSKEENS